MSDRDDTEEPPGDGAHVGPGGRGDRPDVSGDRARSEPSTGEGGSRAASGAPGIVPDRRTGAFDPAVLDRTVIAVPLLMVLHDERERRDAEPAFVPPLHAIIMDLNNDYQRRGDIRTRVRQLVTRAIAAQGSGAPQGIDREKSALSDQYVFARLEGRVIEEIVRLDNLDRPAMAADRPAALTGHRAIHSIWPDFKVDPLLTRSYVTVKADAARAAFSAYGATIVWAVLDSGVDGRHPHFKKHQNLQHTGRLGRAHKDFTGSTGGPLVDELGHGTHVAGILAGEIEAPPRSQAPVAEADTIVAFTRQRDERGRVTTNTLALDRISGVAPRCKLVSLKVLDDTGVGSASNLIVAIEHVQRLNNYGRRLVVHGINMSVGYGYEPEWFACGQSPLCVEVNRLVNSGVVVVVAAGNTGYGWLQAAFKPEPLGAGMDLSINDPGNAELAITVGSTHRESPHTYGVSYFSSKGPTGDGRLKPDLVAPGEKIVSCAAGKKLRDVGGGQGSPVYVENSGTSMAAPHVSGVIAAFLSIRKEFVGQSEAVKQIFMESATDLKRDRHFQGRGLIDLMRAIQSV